ncbi:MAG: hypothetical protein KGI25_09425 [Thaumarchaeota archaeon]|nr:hypothetical protein [Nitrososphaerota archaeon]
MGRPIERLSKPTHAEQFPEKVREMLFMQCVLQVSMGKDFDEHYGPINYHVSERANITMLTFPIGDHSFFLRQARTQVQSILQKKLQLS